MQWNVDTLMDPPFMKDPPVKINVPAKTLGLVYAILGGIGAFFGALAILGFMGLSAAANVAGVLGGLYWLGLLGAVVSLAGTAMAAWGGYQMYQEKREGKRTAVLGLAINVVGNLIGALGGFGDIFGWIVSTAIAFVLYYLVLISRFANEPPVVATNAGGGSPPTR
jgi:hypothetical protein